MRQNRVLNNYINGEWTESTSGKTTPMKAKDFEDVIRIANNVVYGLSSSIYTNDLAKAQRFIEESKIGLCHVNMHTAYKEPQLELAVLKNQEEAFPKQVKVE